MTTKKKTRFRGPLSQSIRNRSTMAAVMAVTGAMIAA
jgi:hypothetical protein